MSADSEIAPESGAPLASAAIAGGTFYTQQPWDGLRRFTQARIALGRAGHSLPTQAHLQFQWAHAQARDAVHIPLDAAALCAQLSTLGLDVLQLHSAAPDRATYLRRPDWGRKLDAPSQGVLQAWRAARPSAAAPEVCFVLADGLSALAIVGHAVPLLQAVLSKWKLNPQTQPTLAPVCVVSQGRVAVGDDVAERLGAQLVVVLIGERPGLSSPDSMGIYLTWAPRVGRIDAERNCISNIRPEGLPVDQAADKLLQLMRQAQALQLTGVDLKDDALLSFPGD
jgi:ethanolamine ammonia-lyase small subunit